MIGVSKMATFSLSLSLFAPNAAFVVAFRNLERVRVNHVFPYSALQSDYGIERARVPNYCRASQG